MSWIEFNAAVGTSIVAWLIQWAFYSFGQPSIRRVLGALAVSSVTMVLAGSILFFVIYTATVPETVTEAAAQPFESGVYFLKLGLLTSIIWLPVLLLVAFDQARRIPKLS